ncbi:AAA ATPase domain-containing protein [Nitrosomonas cryotolerans]|uniref:AAA domain-containing protein, putative AbiEii toxin, Type IV TA system n=1 Tax=Nitrosomonas cryotolerans ATCC 49181 TaxID=1131553 RepID=A0A1N6HU65_9PROT|nr:AAA family ATPase [Nitrosomonas cryotolerans]SFP86564.1 AAA ATPase domain-containing protein [Nitrosomonas cryotolerans]SIO23408.1 AAA domain-containing protein, putative AbiEii toxin, Type IV TA system [Nitrosomonas cryotolerans ATCC 49181]
MSTDITTLEEMHQKKIFEPFIRSIRFPLYRNLTENIEIKFDFPITAITGQNGCHKSSVLRALFGCPEGYSISNFWFSTNIDPIVERSRYIYKTYNEHYDCNAEIIQSRITKPNNPDYWETSRPLKGDGMSPLPEDKDEESFAAKGRSQTRWKKINKNIVFIDFRSEISAFDKALYHGNLSTTLSGKSKQCFIRSKSSLLKKVIENDLASYKPYNGKKEKVQNNILLNSNQISKVCEILGKNYSEIRLVNHKLFNKDGGYSAIIKVDDLNYSEAFAGSGEFAAIMLVYKVTSSNPKSLIILDEPEVSLHPGAQERVMNFLFEMVKANHHQVVLGTHSPFLIEKLPENAIKTLFLNPTTNKVDIINETLKSNAFHYLQVNSHKKLTCYVEDELAKALVDKALESLGEGVATTGILIEYLPGGVNYLQSAIIPPIVYIDRKDVIFLLDGDQEPGFVLENVDINLLNISKLECHVEKIYKSTPKTPVDSNKKSGLNEIQKREAYIKLLNFAKSSIGYLPEKTPEEFIWKHMKKDDLTAEIEHISPHPHNYKKLFSQLTEKTLGLPSYKSAKSQDILIVQKIKLTTLDPKLLEPISNWIKTHLT